MTTPSPRYYSIYNPDTEGFEETTSFAKIVRARMRGNHNAVVVTEGADNPRELNSTEESLINESIASYYNWKSLG